MPGLDFKFNNEKYSINIFYPQFYRNKNLISQSGLFTYVRGPYDNDKGTHYINASLSDNDIDINYSDLDFALNNGQLITNFVNNNVTIGYKLTISRKYLSYFENWLFNRYITYNNLFPDYEGAVKNSIYEFKDLINKEH